MKAPVSNISSKVSKSRIHFIKKKSLEYLKEKMALKGIKGIKS
jgi:hypothetical protein